MITICRCPGTTEPAWTTSLITTQARTRTGVAPAVQVLEPGQILTLSSRLVSENPKPGLLPGISMIAWSKLELPFIRTASDRVMTPNLITWLDTLLRVRSRTPVGT